jgi:hypothetical protein
MSKTQEALRMAIEQMNAVGFMHLYYYQCNDQELLKVIKICEEALAAQAEVDKCEAYCEVKTGYPSSVHWLRINDLRDGTKLYPSPISKEWVGLSSEDVESLVEEHQDDLQTLLYKYEAKLKQLNTEKG